MASVPDVAICVQERRIKMKTPLYNDYFPREEYESRLKRIRGLMDCKGIGAIILSSQQNVEYTSGLLNSTWINGFNTGRQFIILAANHTIEPILIVPYAIQGCLMTSCFSDTRTVLDPGGIEGASMIANIIKDFGCEQEKVGIELPQGACPEFTTGFLDYLYTLLPKVCWENSSSILDTVRMIKSPLEIVKIRHAVNITQNAIEEAFDSFGEGVTERQMAGAIAISMAKQSPDSAVNHPWFIYVHADGKNPIAWDGMFSDYQIRQGDCLYIDCGFIYHGYTADIIRIFAAGEPNNEKVAAYYGARNATNEIIKSIKPGISSTTLIDIYKNNLFRNNFSSQWEDMKKYGFLHVGHGIGLSIHELPILNSSSTGTLLPGMTLSIEPDLFLNLPMGEKTIALKPEENVLVTEDGCELLSNLSSDLWIK
jgi:Xaa-Pro dipeptidase